MVDARSEAGLELDTTQRIIESLSNVCTRAVLFSLTGAPKDATMVSDEAGISLSTAYKSLSILEELGLVEVSRFVISPEGKKVKQYRSRVSKVEITMEGPEPVLSLRPNARLPE
ncbi:MAG: helix-turn-helix transcriptional regulator [Nitrosopumilus sp.]|nr:helix-turn-helix transcriptional regulator [Nitrosopumilus sp.]CAI9831315.1 putative transcriptional regulator [Nitrosopumilaceae archaeon]MDA7940945.1 helix-turn-helix transcriptional regulator [Nitrosopumilus sp.]MDA7943199.1 helix-turn-helix transcriptional regulator [Nitrosopumilus sp.]MDA7944308.1 helix-turn-helix transcriptional regulator [Nitrosopumilus sp.]